MYAWHIIPVSMFPTRLHCLLLDVWMTDTSPVDVIYGTSQSPSEYAVTLQQHLTAAYDLVHQTSST